MRARRVLLSLLTASCNALPVAGRETPNEDIEFPMGTELRDHILGPVCLTSTTHMELPERAKSITDNGLPMRMQLREDIVVPACKRPNKDMEFPTRACPITAKELSKSNRDIERPERLSPNTDKEPLMRKKLSKGT